MNSAPYSYEEMQSWVKDPSKLPPGFWIDPCLPDPLATEADWRDVDERIAKLGPSADESSANGGRLEPNPVNPNFTIVDTTDEFLGTSLILTGAILPEKR